MSKETSWIKQTESVIKNAQLLPMLGSIPAFPKEAFINSFKKALGLEQFDIDITSAEWKNGEEITDGFGDQLFQTAIELTPLKGSCSFIMPREDFSKFSAIITDQKNKHVHFLDPFLQKGFFKYVSLECLSALETTDFLQDLSMKVIDMPLAIENAYCIDIAIKLDKASAWGRILIPSMLQKNIASHFSSHWSYQMHSPLYKAIPLSLSLTLGETKLSYETWKTVKKGDMILLDHLSFNPTAGKGTLILSLKQSPLFLVKLKDHKLKIIDHAFYSQENTMNPNDPSLEPDLESSESELDALTDEIDADTPTQAPNESVDLPLTPPTQVPLTLKVEADQLHMTLEQLLNLKPGNIVETTLSPDTEVHLTLEGRAVAKGVLIQYGDVTGIKITTLG